MTLASANLGFAVYIIHYRI